MVEPLAVCERPEIVIPGGREALYGSQPFPVEIGTGEMYFVPQISALEPRVQAVTYLALLGETNPSISELAEVELRKVKSILGKTMGSFGLISRYALPHYGFSEKICQRTRPIEPFDLGDRTREVLHSMSEGSSRKEVAKHLTLAPISVKSYKSYLNKKMNARGNRARVALMGIMSNEIGNFKTTTPEEILMTQERDAFIRLRRHTLAKNA